MSSSIIIPKPNKIAYNSLKMFQLIVLLNTLSKFIKKVISDRLQNQSITLNFIYPNQLDELKQCLTTNIGLFFIYLIYLGWIKGLQTSILAFDIAQFFLLLNHWLLPLILDKASFNSRISLFFFNYLKNLVHVEQFCFSFF